METPKAKIFDWSSMTGSENCESRWYAVLWNALESVKNIDALKMSSSRA